MKLYTVETENHIHWRVAVITEVKKAAQGLDDTLVQSSSGGIVLAYYNTCQVAIMAAS
jgi:hypothetical protein